MSLLNQTEVIDHKEIELESKNLNMGEVMNKRLFHSLTQQLRYEVFFVTDVGEPYYDAPNELEIVEFSYKGQQCELILNGSIKLKTQQNDQDIESYQELLKGLMRSSR